MVVGSKQHKSFAYLPYRYLLLPYFVSSVSTAIQSARPRSHVRICANSCLEPTCSYLAFGSHISTGDYSPRPPIPDL
eukprot:scaffold6764_cov169-Amphora_coffeaeformis.AAC.12